MFEFHHSVFPLGPGLSAYGIGRFGYLIPGTLVPRLEVRLIKSFALGAFYLVSGVYSTGFGLFMSGLMKPVSGTEAYVMAPDALFPYEVALFLTFGAAFLIASLFQFRNSMSVALGPRQITE